MVLQQAVDVREHARAPVVVVWGRVQGQRIALRNQPVVQSEVFPRLVRLGEQEDSRIVLLAVLVIEHTLLGLGIDVAPLGDGA